MTGHELSVQLEGDNFTGRCSCGWEVTAAESTVVHELHEAHAAPRQRMITRHAPLAALALLAAGSSITDDTFEIRPFTPPPSFGTIWGKGDGGKHRGHSKPKRDSKKDRRRQIAKASRKRNRR